MSLFSTGDCWEVVEGTEKLLASIKSKPLEESTGTMARCGNPLVLGIISNFDPRLHTILRLKGIQSSFDFVLTSHEAQLSKPDRRIFEKALNLASALDPTIEASNTLHIGDNYEIDCVGAINAGWNSILFDPIGNKVTNSDANPTIPIVRSLDALNSYIFPE